jgi:hypothetical protein
VLSSRRFPTIGFGILGTILALTTLTACGSPTSPSTPLPLTRFRAEPTSFLIGSGYDQPRTLVIHDRDTWVRTWADIYRRADPPPPIPEIDFANEMVVVAALGPRPSSGFDVIFTGAAEAGDVVTVDVESRTPAPSCVTLPVVTSPVDIARIPRRNGAVTFRTTGIVVNCP